ncbi:hypothetical protein N181_16820 [Sinorhizobium fredii USDA 205]|nr:hypothetical protein N181_16820 [Sinorhizobium fredii USDA 205]
MTGLWMSEKGPISPAKDSINAIHLEIYGEVIY